MSTHIFAAASLVFGLMMVGGVVYLLCKIWREREMQCLTSFADSLPEHERVIFWRLWHDRASWNTSRYPKALKRWKREYQKISATASGVRRA
jgi:hypothetical protein